MPRKPGRPLVERGAGRSHRSSYRSDRDKGDRSFRPLRYPASPNCLRHYRKSRGKPVTQKPRRMNIAVASWVTLEKAIYSVVAFGRFDSKPTAKSCFRNSSGSFVTVAAMRRVSFLVSILAEDI